MIDGAPHMKAVKRRQHLLLAGIGAVIVLGTVLSVSLTSSRRADDRPARPTSSDHGATACEGTALGMQFATVRGVGPSSTRVAVLDIWIMPARVSVARVRA